MPLDDWLKRPPDTEKDKPGGDNPPLPEMPIEVRRRGPRAALVWLLGQGLLAEDLEAEFEALRARTGEKVQAVVVGEDQEPLVNSIPSLEEVKSFVQTSWEELFSSGLDNARKALSGKFGASVTVEAFLKMGPLEGDWVAAKITIAGQNSAIVVPRLNANYPGPGLTSWFELASGSQQTGPIKELRLPAIVDGGNIQYKGRIVVA